MKEQMAKRWKQFKHFFQRVTVQITILVVAAMLIINVFTIIFSQKSMEVMEKDSRNNVLNIGQIYMKDIDNELYNLDHFLYDRFPDGEGYLGYKTAQNALEMEIAWNGMYNMLRNWLNENEEGDAFAFYDRNREKGEASIRSGLYEHPNRIRSSLVAYLAENSRNLSRKWEIVEINEERWLCRVLKDGNMFYGAFIRLKTVEEDFCDLTDYAGIRSSIKPQNGEKASDTNGYIYLECPSERAQMKLEIGVPISELLKELSLLQRAGTLVAGLLLLLIPLTVLVLHRSILRPIEILDEAMERVEQGEVEYQITQRAGGREFRHLFQAFNRMVRVQNELKIAVYEEKLSRQRLEIQNLRLQIHPHFLLNSFNLMYGMAGAGKMEQLKSMLLYLSDYFRYIFRSGKETESLEKEIELVRHYLEIATMRYPNAFEADIDLEPACEAVQIPPLLIHNLVENIIRHGLMHDRVIQIRIMAYKEEERVHILVSDNGRGISREILEKLKKEEFVENGREIHIGIQNTIQRVRQLLKDGEVHIDSVEGEGTVIEIEFT